MPGPSRTEPAIDHFMDCGMRRLWRSMGPLPGDLRLYGGTGLATYLGHRRSTDFDFATPAPVVDLAFAAGISWLRDARLNGGPGMVDAVVPVGERDVVVTLMECGHLVPMPTMAPRLASNGVAVAHPVDLAAAKMEACFTRGALRDYEDVAEAIQTWPDWCRQAAVSLPGRSPDAVARMLASPPGDVESRLDRGRMRGLRSFAFAFGRNQGMGR